MLRAKKADGDNAGEMLSPRCPGRLCKLPRLSRAQAAFGKGHLNVNLRGSMETKAFSLAHSYLAE